MPLSESTEMNLKIRDNFTLWNIFSLEQYFKQSTIFIIMIKLTISLKKM